MWWPSRGCFADFMCLAFCNCLFCTVIYAEFVGGFSSGVVCFVASWLEQEVSDWGGVIFSNVCHEAFGVYR
jgi:hypothetical protein